MGKEKENFLDYIPRHNSLYEYRENKDGMIEIMVENKGFFHRLAQLIAKKPKVSYIELAGMGSFIWKQMDGKKTIYEIGQELKKEYKEEAEPLYERLCQYIRLLHNQHYIVYQNKIKEKVR